MAIRGLPAALLGAALLCGPALSYAQHSGGGGGGGGGGGHMSGGGGGGGHMSGGGGHAGGGAAPAGHGGYYGGHYAAAPHYTAAPHYYSAATHYGYGAGTHFTGGAYGGHGYPSAHSYPTAHSYPSVHGYPSGHGYAVAPGVAHGPTFVPHYWGGGYWHGVFWPHVWYYPGYAWWLPVLPFGYATFWWGGYPYYYVNNVYYTTSPDYSGYVATDPPMAAGTADPGADTYSDGSQPGDAAQAMPPPNAAPQPYGGGAGPDVYVYPRNGQNDQQTAFDRYECHGWAVSQTGFDPTRAGPQQGNGEDYRRAIIACLDARGYTAR